MCAFVNATGVPLASRSLTSSICSTTKTQSLGAVTPGRARVVVDHRHGNQVTMKSDAWVQLLPTSDISPGELKGVFTAGQSLLVSCDYDGQVYASANICPHLGTPLVDGSVGDGVLTCAQHKSSWDLSTGELAGDWCPFPPLLGPLLGKLQGPKNLQVYPVRENAGYIEALINVDARKDFEKDYWFGLLDATGKSTGGYY
eukprot:Plantae.Rhodophyta-Hildenbrandia_rubra.ctg10437.p1 GENE.Plantae.Rhodophyta-Hildenbrandia_rubra.ctg10437~~Plantae.Rhodophyta-Hildenbrandia_rubra.ctg10437.p1  ORF type:complete len:218 (+),score=45.34 Plantae.Rhodophyta-Hildenbrandia_rubra.ctg10437:56-655(+)